MQGMKGGHMMNNKSMMQDKTILEHLNSMMTNMNLVMNNYKDMMNHLHDKNKAK